MPLILGIIGLFAPRFVIVLLWLLSGWFNNVFETRLWPVLGLLFMPFTLLWYSAMQNWFQGVWEWWHLVILLIAIVSDLGSGSSATRKKSRE